MMKIQCQSARLALMLRMRLGSGCLVLKTTLNISVVPTYKQILQIDEAVDCAGKLYPPA